MSSNESILASIERARSEPRLKRGVVRCNYCDEWIFEGERYLDHDAGAICVECLRGETEAIMQVYFGLHMQTATRGV